MQASLEGCPALVLNADFRPLSYHPLSVWPWQEAIKASYLGRVNIVAVYDRIVLVPMVDRGLTQHPAQSAQRHLPQGICDPDAAAGFHAIQCVPA